MAVEQVVQTSNTKFVYVFGNGTEAPLDITAGNVDIPNGEQIKFSTDWAIDGVVQDGDTFQVSIPESLEVVVELPFELKNSDGVAVALCTYTSTSPYVATCVFQGAPAGGYVNPNGNMFITVRGFETSVATDITFNVGGSPIVIPHVGVGDVPPAYASWKKQGQMWTETVDGETRARGYWEIYMIGGSTVTVSDQLSTTSPNHPHTFDGYFNLERYRITETFPNGDVLFDPATKEPVVGAPSPTVSADRRSFTVDLQTEAGWLYVYGYGTMSDGQVLEQDLFGNTATLNGVDYSAEASTMVFAGGTADSDTLFGFDIAKTVVNEGGLTLPDAFEIVATSSAPGQTPYPMTVPADGTKVSSKYFPAGYSVEICEVEPSVSGAIWSYLVAGETVVMDPDTDCATILPAGGTRIDLQLTNTFVPVEPEVPVTPVTPGSPETPPAPKPPVLVETGAENGTLLGAGALLVMVGAGLTRGRLRRPQRDSR